MGRSPSLSVFAFPGRRWLRGHGRQVSEAGGCHQSRLGSGLVCPEGGGEGRGAACCIVPPAGEGEALKSLSLCQDVELRVSRCSWHVGGGIPGPDPGMATDYHLGMAPGDPHASGTAEHPATTAKPRLIPCSQAIPEQAPSGLLWSLVSLRSSSHTVRTQGPFPI